MTQDEIIKLILQVQGAGTLDEARAAAEKLKDKLEETAKAGDKAEKSTRNMGRATLEAGRFLQDFAQGGIGGVLNNIEGLVMALGKGPGLAGVLTAVGLGAYFALPRIKSFLAAVIEGANKVPESKDKIEALTDALARNKKETEELAKKGALTNQELARYNQLTTEATRVTKELTEAKKRQAEFEKLRESKTDEEKETGSLVQEYVGSDIDALRRLVTGQVAAAGAKSGHLGELNERLRKAALAQARHAQEDPFDLSGVGPKIQADIDALRKQAATERARLAEEADRLVSGALSGKAGALEGMLHFLPEGSRFKRHLAELTPEARRRQDQDIDATEAEGTAAIERGRKRRAAERKQQQARKADQDAANHMLDLKRRGEAAQVQKDAALEARTAHAHVDLARRVSKAAARPEAVPAGKLPLIPEGAGPMAIQAAMLANQAQMIQNQAALQQLVDRARAVGHHAGRLGRRMRQDLEQGPQASGLPR
jgi:hypothetical protein